MSPFDSRDLPTQRIVSKQFSENRRFAALITEDGQLILLDSEYFSFKGKSDLQKASLIFKKAPRSVTFDPFEENLLLLFDDASKANEFIESNFEDKSLTEVTQSSFALDLDEVFAASTASECLKPIKKSVELAKAQNRMNQAIQK